MVVRSMIVMLLAGLFGWAVTRQPAVAKELGDRARARAADLLRAALNDAGAKAAAPEQQRDSLVQAAGAAADLLAPKSRAAERLRSAIAEASGPTGLPPAEAATALRRSLAEVAKDLGFRLRVEAEQPEGFPSPTPVGEIELKQYPVYRKAQTESSPNAAFWKLFTHIKRNDIAMTAPVEMQYEAAADSPRQQNMAFLYGKPDMGETGKVASVDVLDVPQMTVVSLGVRGPQNQRSVLEAQRQLEAWLKANDATWIATGPLRTMGFNSPFVPREQNYFEVQIPIQKTTKQPVAAETELRPAANS